jgi:3-oxoacyl-[acyl-carrier protein] reductase
MKSIDLTGKIVLVTGGTSDLGRVMVRTFADCGANVAIHYHKNIDMANRLVAEVEAKGAKAIAIQADITKQTEVERMRDIITASLGAPTIVVCNAVSQYKWMTILEQRLEDFTDQFDMCVLHNVLIAKTFLPYMIERREGRLIGINSECSVQNRIGSAAYASAKRGMDGIYRVLAKEVGEYNITVNQIAPGWMISDRDRADGTEHAPEYERDVPLRRRGEDQEIANAAIFLASDLAGYITGVYLPVCGGNVMPGI